MTDEELDNRFSYHPPKAETVIEDYQHIRACAKGLAAVFDELCPEGREKALALTKIEEAMFWANAAIARG